MSLFKKTPAAEEPRIRPKLIRYDFPDNRVLVHKESGYPILHSSQLIVGPSQTVVMVRNGQILHRFESGQQILDTGVLASTLKQYALAYDGGENGVPVDLYFINKLFSDAMPWGTPSPIQIVDPSVDLYIRLTANGQFRYQIVDPELFIRTNLSANVADLNRICKQKVLGHLAEAIQKYVQQENVGYFELAARTVAISDRLLNIINAKTAGAEGFQLAEFTIAAFQADEEDLAALKETKQNAMRIKKEAEARAYARNVEGYTYREQRQFDILQEAAGNQGAMGGVMGAAMGAGMGLNMGSQLGSVMNPAQPAAATAVTCTGCGAPLAAGAKFCAQCGTAVPQKQFCIHCGAELPAGARFCSSCGKPQ